MTENVLKVYRHEKPEWTPIWMQAVQSVGLWAGNECGLRGERVQENIALDVFGVEWQMDHGTPMPALGKFLLEDICDWREVVKFPEPKTWDWEMLASVELKDRDPNKALTYFCEQGLWDRLVQLMGFESAAMALLTDPEECDAFFSRVADYKIELIECVAKYIKPDIFMYTDDVAKSDSLFMHPDTYRKLIKPHHARIIKAIKDNGMIPEQHTCGKCEAIIDDYVEIGIECFFPAQSSNDLVAIQKKHGKKMCLNGGFDSQGPAGYEDASEETTRAEARRMANEYAVNGGFIALPMIGDPVTPPTPSQAFRMMTFFDEFRKECNKLGI